MSLINEIEKRYFHKNEENGLRVMISKNNEYFMECYVKETDEEIVITGSVIGLSISKYKELVDAYIQEHQLTNFDIYISKFFINITSKVDKYDEEKFFAVLKEFEDFTYELDRLNRNRMNKLVKNF